MMHKVRIQNNGQPGHMTRVTDADTGEALDGYVTHVAIEIDARQDMPQATLTIGYPVVGVIADAQIKRVCPVCGRPEEKTGGEQ